MDGVQREQVRSFESAGVFDELPGEMGRRELRMVRRAATGVALVAAGAALLVIVVVSASDHDLLPLLLDLASPDLTGACRAGRLLPWRRQPRAPPPWPLGKRRSNLRAGRRGTSTP